ncbi:YeeE/YedE family protein [Psychrobacter pygoscelis]|uniref:YeeE/YedE family protein n=1 Tax=Psychrobacter pygoscelis TaxID=2488563 RepID=UPI00103C5DB3|nr:YeeE/YedE thiosulfate transporter family protein [Psychrobacter pygoscelis]
MSTWIDWANFTPISALLGGALIGLAAAILITGIGRILGMSGIINSALAELPKLSWQLAFVIGMAVTTWLYSLVIGFPEFEIDQPAWRIILAGLLVGFGTRLGSGCTSGHGVCGISRLSTRSITATVTFMVGGIVTASLFALI